MSSEFVHFLKTIIKQKKGGVVMTMNIFELLCCGGVFCLSGITDPEDLFLKVIPDEIILEGVGKLSKKDIIDQILERERRGPVVQEHIAFPHINIYGVERPFVMLVVLEDKIDYFNNPCDIFFIMLDSVGKMHVGLLRAVAELLRKPGFVDRLRGVDSSKQAFEVLSIFNTQQTQEASV